MMNFKPGWLYPERDDQFRRRRRIEDFNFGTVYDSKTGGVKPRTTAGWVNLGIFYLCFYASLVLFSVFGYWAYLQTLDPRIPRNDARNSMIDLNPGLGFRPMPFDDLESTLIWFNGSNATSYMPWVNHTMEFLQPYYVPGDNLNSNYPLLKCDFDVLPRDGQACKVPVEGWTDECSAEDYFNYHRNSPCIFIKLNKIYNWIPEYYDDPYNLPHDMPLSLKWHIGNITVPKHRQVVWVSCEGENPADVEFLGKIQYFPVQHHGFPSYYFPYRHAEGYLNPLVAIKINKPISGIVINVECRAWAKNIKYSRAQRTGSVHFELLVD